MASPSDNAAVSLLAVLWTETAIATVLVGLRYYTRLKVNRVMGWDDHIMLAALVLSLSGASILTTAFTYGFGRHETTVPSDELAEALMYENIAQPLLVMGLNTARISITILLIRLFPTKAGLRTFLIWITIMNCVSTIIPIVFPFTCHPVQKQWKPSLEGSCPNPRIQVGFAILKAALSAFTDLAVALWPILIIWSLQMKAQAKAALGLIFGLSLLAMVGSIVEACFLSKLGDKSDISYDLPMVFIWIGTQCNLVIIIGTIPALRPLFQKVFGKRESSGTVYKYSDKSKQTRKSLAQPNQIGHLGTILTPDNGVTNVIITSESQRENEYLEDRAGSEEYILPTTKNHEPLGSIHVLTDVNVAYTKPSKP